MYGYLFDLILVFLTLGDKRLRLLADSFLRPNLLWYVQNFQWVQKWETSLFQFIDKFLIFEEKFEMSPAFCKFLNSPPTPPSYKKCHNFRKANGIDLKFYDFS